MSSRVTSSSANYGCLVAMDETDVDGHDDREEDTWEPHHDEHG